MHFEYKSGFSFTNIQLSVTNITFKFFILRLSPYYWVRILPKGTSFDKLSQDDISLMMDNINSYKQKKLNDHSPYGAFSFLHGEEILNKIGCHSVAAEDIILKSSLLKK